MPVETTPSYQMAAQKCSAARLRHSCGTAEFAQSLAQVYGEDAQRAFDAGMLHDIFRDTPVEEQRAWAQRLKVPLKGAPSLWHGPIAAAYLLQQTLWNDRVLCNAIACHTTGRLGMTMLDKILYIADKCEKGRQYPGVEELRKLAREDLNQAVTRCLEQSIRHAVEKGAEPAEDAVAALEYLRMGRI